MSYITHLGSSEQQDEDTEKHLGPPRQRAGYHNNVTTQTSLCSYEEDITFILSTENIGAASVQATLMVGATLARPRFTIKVNFLLNLFILSSATGLELVRLRLLECSH